MPIPEIIIMPKGHLPTAEEKKKKDDAKKKGGILYEADRAIAMFEMYEMFRKKQPKKLQ